MPHRLALFLILCLLGTVSFAVSTGEAAQADAGAAARKALETTVTTILDRIKNPAYANPATRPPLRAEVEKQVQEIFNFNEFSSRTVGANWRTFSPEQKERFSKAFAELLMSTYLDRIDGYNGEKINYTGEISSPSGDRVEVRTTLTLKNGSTIPVAYRMLPQDGTWRVYDVLIEGVSLVKNYRTQFQDILSKGTPEQLIARVQDKAREMREKPNAK